jgi:alpha-D-xyloside xylohydrolase
MKKITFGTPEMFVPTNFCKELNYKETEIKYNISEIKFRETPRGCLLEFPILCDEEVFGFGLQLKGFAHKNHKLHLS